MWAIDNLALMPTTPGVTISPNALRCVAVAADNLNTPGFFLAVFGDAAGHVWVSQDQGGTWNEEPAGLVGMVATGASNIPQLF